jgi:hypothetical protein
MRSPIKRGDHPIVDALGKTGPADAKGRSVRDFMVGESGMQNGRRVTSADEKRGA